MQTVWEKPSLLAVLAMRGKGEAVLAGTVNILGLVVIESTHPGALSSQEVMGASLFKFFM